MAQNGCTAITAERDFINTPQKRVTGEEMVAFMLSHLFKLDTHINKLHNLANGKIEIRKGENEEISCDQREMMRSCTQQCLLKLLHSGIVSGREKQPTAVNQTQPGHILILSLAGTVEKILIIKHGPSPAKRR